MSQSPSTIAETSVAKGSHRKQQGSILSGMLSMLILFAVPVVLYGLTAQGMQGTFRYWEYFILFIALFSLGSGWNQVYLSRSSSLWYLVKQVAHWGGLIGLLYVLNTQGIRMLMNDHQYTILLTYLMAFTVILAAINMDFKLIFFGGFLAYCAFLIAVPANNQAVIAIGEQFGIANPATHPLQVTLYVAGVALVASLIVRMYIQSAAASKRARS